MAIALSDIVRTNDNLIEGLRRRYQLDKMLLWQLLLSNWYD